ncbi:hypothetical protein [Mesorhizobium sp. L2C084A000]|uniref:hypothetical protein n=1 Tax=unclassified Mesorhizobium TaxID=325217 RepID=UPI0003D02C59|nr:hypothetical protein [Mesorhizobium sp. L2C084A000]ESZ26922.1 hypothetical protein X734_14585 [Mesorhizobium sp. L2C084A000]
MEQAEAFLLDQVSLVNRSYIPTTLKAAYEAAALVVKDEPIFNVNSALDNRGRVIQWSIDLAFERLVQTGKWPFEYRWRSFEHPTGRYLEILPSHSVLTISQVADHSAQPRDVRFRANKRASGQGWLSGLPKLPEKTETSGLPHLLLLHGHKEPNFAHLAMPRSEHETGFYCKSANLMLMPHAVQDAGPPVEETDFEAVMTLKEEIDKWRKDHAG